jgi:hypothetical protein
MESKVAQDEFNELSVTSSPSANYLLPQVLPLHLLVPINLIPGSWRIKYWMLLMERRTEELVKSASF